MSERTPAENRVRDLMEDLLHSFEVAKAERLAAASGESVEYHLGQLAARADRAAGRERDHAAGLEAPLDWLRGYDDERAEISRDRSAAPAHTTGEIPQGNSAGSGIGPGTTGRAVTG